MLNSLKIPRGGGFGKFENLGGVHANPPMLMPDVNTVILILNLIEYIS